MSVVSMIRIDFMDRKKLAKLQLEEDVATREEMIAKIIEFYIKYRDRVNELDIQG